MPRGPVPQQARRRNNAPTIPSTVLPAAGRTGRAPRPPHGITLGEPGEAWWRWAWRTPQAAAWDAGNHSTIARLASLWDDLAVLDAVDDLNVAELLPVDPAAILDALPDVLASLQAMIRSLKALASGRLQVMREMRELEDDLGLSARSRLQLRWVIGDSTADDAEEDDDEVTARRVERERRLAQSV